MGRLAPSCSATRSTGQPSTIRWFSSSCRRKRSHARNGLPRQPPTGVGTQRLTRCRRAYVGRQHLRSSQAAIPTRGLVRLVRGSIRPVRRSGRHQLSVRLGSPEPSAGRRQPYESQGASLATRWASRHDPASHATRSALARDEPVWRATIRRSGARRSGGQARSATFGSTKMSWRAATVRVSPATAGRIQDPAASHRLCSSPCRAGG